MDVIDDYCRGCAQETQTDERQAIHKCGKILRKVVSRNYYAWPLDCLNLRYNSSLNDSISKSSPDICDAASNGYIGFVQYYVEKEHVELNFCKNSQTQGQTPLHMAVKFGRLNVVEYLTSKLTPGKLNGRNYENETPLMYAALYGQLSIAKYLLEEAKVDSSYNNKDKSALLDSAALGGNLELLRYLVEKKKYVVRTRDSKLLLSAAAGGNVKVIKYLLCHKRLISVGTDGEGDTGLHKAAYNGKLEMVKIFVNSLNYDVDVRNNEELTPAHSATQGGSLLVLRYLIEEKKADLYAQNGFGDYLVHIAAHYGNLEIFIYLVDTMGMSVELKDYMWRTPLHRAVNENHLDVVEYLAGMKRADLNCKDRDGRNILHKAVFTGNIKMMEYLINNMSMIDRMNDRDPFMNRSLALDAAYAGELTILKFLVDDKNASTSVVDSEGKNMLHTAAKEVRFEVVKYLVEVKNFDVWAKTPGDLTARDLAMNSEKNNTELLSYLYKLMYPSDS